MKCKSTAEVKVTGGSMAPFIPPGSRLHITGMPFEEINKGDVVCYLGENKKVIAHRVTRMLRSDNGGSLFVRGDAQNSEEQVPRDAVISVVRRVEHRLLSYDTTGPVGRVLARIALAEDAKTRLARLFLRSAWNALCLARIMTRRDM